MLLASDNAGDIRPFHAVCYSHFPETNNLPTLKEAVPIFKILLVVNMIASVRRPPPIISLQLFRSPPWPTQTAKHLYVFLCSSKIYCSIKWPMLTYQCIYWYYMEFSHPSPFECLMKYDLCIFNNTFSDWQMIQSVGWACLTWCGGFDCLRNRSTAIGGSDRQVYCYWQTENMMHFD
jgi:hypothetical protein